MTDKSLQQEILDRDVTIEELARENELLRAFHERIGRCGSLVWRSENGGPSVELTIFRFSYLDDYECSEAYRAALSGKDKA